MEQIEQTSCAGKTSNTSNYSNTSNGNNIGFVSQNETNPVTSVTGNKGYSQQELFELREMAMPITTDLVELWNIQDARARLLHPMRDFAKYLLENTDRLYDVHDIWQYLCHFKIPYMMLRYDFFDDYIALTKIQRADWLCEVLRAETGGLVWKKDLLIKAMKLKPGMNLFFQREAATSTRFPAPKKRVVMKDEQSETKDPGLSDFEFRRNGVRYYYDETEKRDIEIPEDFEPRPDAEAWLNTHSGWMHG